MEVIFSAHALNDLEFWKQTGNKKVLQRIRSLIENIQENPFRGIGKPEPLKYEYSGMWSRRIDKVHRIIYEIMDDSIIVHAVKDHY